MFIVRHAFVDCKVEWDMIKDSPVYHFIPERLQKLLIYSTHLDNFIITACNNIIYDNTRNERIVKGILKIINLV